MTPPSPSFTDRLRAGMAALLARLATGAHRLEEWSARGMRPVLLGLAVIAVLVVGALAVVGPGRHAVSGWMSDDTRPGHTLKGLHAKPDGKFEMKPGGGHAIGKPDGKPEAPRRPGPPAPPQPPIAP